MKKVALLGAVLGLSAVMAGCGLIPPVALTNPLGLDGKKTPAVTLNTPAKGAISTQNVSGTATFTSKFADDANISIPITPSSLTIGIAFKGVELGGTCTVATLPKDVITLSLSNIKVKASDAAKNVEKTLAGPLSFTVTRANGALTVSNFSPIWTAAYAAAEITSMLDIFKTGGENTVDISFNISTTDITTGGCTMTFTFGAGSGEVKI